MECGNVAPRVLGFHPLDVQQLFFPVPRALWDQDFVGIIIPSVHTQL